MGGTNWKQQTNTTVLGYFNAFFYFVLYMYNSYTYVLVLQVEGALTRAYNRWIEDLTSLPEYQASLQTEKEKWEELQEKHIEQQVWCFVSLSKTNVVIWLFCCDHV